MKKEIFIAITIITISVFFGIFSFQHGWEMKGVDKSVMVLGAGVISLFVAIIVSVVSGRINPNIKERVMLATVNVLMAVSIVGLISGLRIAISVSLVFLFFSFVGITLFAHERKSNDFMGISLAQVLVIVVVMTLTMII